MTLQATSNDAILLGRGQLFFDRHSSGARTGYINLGECNAFGVSFEDDVLKLNTSQNSTGGVHKQVTRQRTVNVSITSKEFTMANLAIALMGTQGTFTQTSSAITGEVLTTSVAKGRYYKTAGRNITGVVITQGTATWALSTDYTIHDASAGIIGVNATTSTDVTTATTATIAYTRASLSLDQIFGATETTLEGSLLFVPDPATGPQFDIEVFKVSVTPGGELGFISEEFGEYTLALTALDDSAGAFGGSTSSPYFTKIQRGTA